MESQPYRNSSMVVGLVLIALGLVFFVATQGAFNLKWGTIWPLFIMIAGAALLLTAFSTSDPKRRGGIVVGGTIPLLVGAFFFATTTGLLSWSDQGSLWPIYPLVVGVAFFAASFASNHHPGYLVPGAILVLVGLVFGAIMLTNTPYSYIGKIWPIFLIIGGLLVLIVPRFGWATRHEPPIIK